MFLLLRPQLLLCIYTALVRAQVVKHFLGALVEDFLGPFHATDAEIDIPTVLEERGRWSGQPTRPDRHRRACLVVIARDSVLCTCQSATRRIKWLLVALPKWCPERCHGAAEDVLCGEKGQRALVFA